jgi:hypothetical protein
MNISNGYGCSFSTWKLAQLELALAVGTNHPISHRASLTITTSPQCFPETNLLYNLANSLHANSFPVCACQWQ